ncbi:hypothetical protein IC611_01940 [Proteus mirabilis]
MQLSRSFNYCCVIYHYRCDFIVTVLVRGTKGVTFSRQEVESDASANATGSE